MDWAVYLGVPLAAALVVFLVATMAEYPVVERLGAAVWTFFLVLIISMPTLSGYLRRGAEG
ncbi:MAG: hypothetical protein EPO21_04375 [Chloroflexota bacterium]|nr:MAG: hypothetical protein EPO21_04375 [Chloroflexota bacterium]